jgi:hypothetical protein
VSPEDSNQAPKIFYLASALVVIVCAVVSMVKVKEGWDDGAITAAFAQSWADSGRIALTPLSPEVEGFSSLSWFLLLSLPRFVTHTPNAILVWMKLLSACAFGGSLAVFARVARRFGFTAWQAAFATVLLAFTVSPFREVFNGMEMNLCMLLLLSLIDLLTSGMRSSRLLVLSWVFSFLLLATRFESPFLLLALFAGCILARRTDPRIPAFGILAWMAGGDALLFLAISLWRHARFGLWMPNTVYAKLWEPYHHSGLHAALLTRYHAVSELFIVFPALFAVAAGLALLRTWRRVPAEDVMRSRGAVHPLLVSVAAASVAFGLLFGQNWGYPGRMVLPTLPMLLLLLVDQIFRWARSRVELQTALVVVAVLQCGAWFYFAGRVMLHGEYVPTWHMETEGLASEAIRRDLHLDSLRVMIPDVGGAGLCCERLEILDSALLTNPYLAKHGYQMLVPYFREESPQVVESSLMWGQVSNIYTTGVLDDYGIVAFRDFRFFVRRDIYDALTRVAGVSKHQVQDWPACYGYIQADQVEALRFHTCLVMPAEMPPIR